MFSKAIVLFSASLPLIQAAPPDLSGYSITWSDDFTGSADSLPSASDWIVDTGTSYSGGTDKWGTGEIQTYTDKAENLKLTGSSQLQITPIRDDSGKWTSGRIETKRTDFQAKAGGKMRISASISLPDVTGDAALGYWAAFWTLGNDFRDNFNNWPGVGEFDILENVNGVDQIWGYLHCGTNPDGVCKEPSGLGSTSKCPKSACQGNFHVYSLEVDRSSNPESLTWSVDDTVYQTVTKDELGAETWQTTMDSGHFILLNVAMGGALPDGVSGSTTPTDTTESGKPMLVDWVAVYNSS